MSESQLVLVSNAVAAHKGLLSDICASTAFHPSGIPSWDAEWLSVGLHARERDLVTVWKRGGTKSQTVLSLPRWAGQEISVDWLGATQAFTSKWDASGYLILDALPGQVLAGTFAIAGAGS